MKLPEFADSDHRENALDATHARRSSTHFMTFHIPFKHPTAGDRWGYDPAVVGDPFLWFLGSFADR